ncbi:hypothetical protein CEXT_653041 [Caerostris extrusa]|uniref:Uncharacterized protein n=1 Tax=Caerostris extrusa TaxID=172846 RepID=A0AAV4QNM2_CAEEX|nr:hypothetical protein CEXT_653041 [Caerostris extrusa]
MRLLLPRNTPRVHKHGCRPGNMCRGDRCISPKRAGVTHKPDWAVRRSVRGSTTRASDFRQGESLHEPPVLAVSLNIAQATCAKHLSVMFWHVLNMLPAQLVCPPPCILSFKILPLK